MTRIAIVDNKKLRDPAKKRYIQGLCPVNRTGKECIKIEGDGKLFIDEKLCTGCGICPNAAPEAIKIVNLPEALKDDPIHRYGENQFVLYSLPTPLFGKVIGLLGVNGIGKSTAIKILAGALNPNFGIHTAKGDYKRLVEFFKGTEAQAYFEKVHRGEIKVAYKPQQVDLIPKLAKGSVKDLLRKVDEVKRFDEIVQLLELGEILETDIAHISGGELQRVAIAATVLRNANVYVFDEPTSYLDIKQRLKISKFIKSLATPTTAVMVVEHDLIILDYIADLVQIMYGREGAYGIVSGPKPTKTAINVFLGGFLKEENIRFRNYAIQFSATPPVHQRSSPVIVTWKNLSKRMDSFTFAAHHGSIHDHDIVGVLGENGIGKTTFAKILAGVEAQDGGELSSKITVSYKPQYLQSDSDDVVMVFLDDAIRRFSAQLIDPLGIKPLFEKQLNQLSGGELQRVAIARALSQTADLYVLDEPSAYLDVEQRLVVSKVIRDLLELSGKSAFVIDHDLLFLDYVSKSLMVFFGKPAVSGEARGPYLMEEGMNHFLEDLNITLRRDKESHRPRINKEESVMDREQKGKGKYYYS